MDISPRNTPAPDRREKAIEDLAFYDADSVQEYGTANLTDCIDTAPTIHEMAHAAGKKRVLLWLTDHLSALSAFSGARRTLNDRQLLGLAEIVYNEYGWLNIRELMVFFYRLKLGSYGMSYGSFDPGVVLRAIRAFLVERMAAVRIVEDERAREELRRTDSRCVTYAEYKRMLAAGELDHLMSPEEKAFFGRGG